MKQPHRRAAAATVCATLLCTLLPAPAPAASRDLGDGFTDHGVAVPISNHRGTVATDDGAGHDVVLSLLMDYRGGYELLLLDPATGNSEEHPMPFKVHGDSPYASILSSRNKFYCHFESNFAEFDPSAHKFTFAHKTTPQMAMSMTEDDRGVIWSASYPDSAVCSYDPQTKTFKDYGSLYQQNWKQYPRSIAADDTGHIYVGLGATAAQIISLDPETGKATPVIPDGERPKGYATVVRDEDGKVYGRASDEKDAARYELYKGEARRVPARENAKPKPYITGNQGLFHAEFPDGKTLKALDLVDRKLTIADKDGKSVTHPIDYASEGAIVMGCATAADGTIAGGTAFPMRFFALDPKTDTLSNRAAYGQWNAVHPYKDRYYVGGYGGGFLLEWTPGNPWVPTEKNKPGCNPQFLTAASPTIHRPTDVLPLTDDRTIVLVGGPDYGYTGGGLCFYDRQSKQTTILKDTDVIPNQSTRSIVELPDGKLLGATTTAPGTGGEKKATQAVLYVLDLATKKVQWQAPLIPGTQDYLDLCPAPDGTVYGVADQKTFFVFDPKTRQITAKQNLLPEFGQTVAEQGPRVFVPGEKDETFVILERGLARVDDATHHLAWVKKSPVELKAGGAYLNGTLYVVSASHLISYKVR